MTDKDIEQKLKAAIERTAPDGLGRLLSDIDNRKGDIIMEKTAVSKKKNRWIGLVAALLAVALLGGAGGIYYGQNYTVATTVSLDVNPSIQLEVNRSEKVLTCTGLNDEGREILASMNGGADLKGSRLNVAVNAIVGAIVRAGYLDSLSSAILISVEDDNAARGERLQAELVAEVDGVLQTAANSAGVLSQYLTVDAGLNQQAQQNNISSGKAALVNQVLALNASLDFEKLAALSVEELRDLIKIGAPGMPIGRTEAARIAEEYAGTDVLDIITLYDVDPELDDPVPHYEVEIRLAREYDYTIHAFTGEVLSGEANITGRASSQTSPAPDLSEPAVTADDAFNKAADYCNATHPELSTYNIFDITVKYDRDDGHYDVEFWCDGCKFDYDVDGQTGDILREETDYRYTPPKTPDTTPPADTAPPDTTPKDTTPKDTTPKDTTPKDTTPVDTTPKDTTPAQPADIGVEAAKAAALKHAGITEGQVTYWEKAQKDYDNGRWEYEIDFTANGTEYDYEIDAATGAVLQYETEKVRTPAGQQGTPTTQPADIGEAAAKAAALARAGVSEADATWIKCQREYDDGRLEYEIEFIAGGTEYDITVLAADGAVTKYETERSKYNTGSSGGTQTGDIGADAAKAAALQHAGLTQSQVTRLKCERDYDDGRLVYEIEFKSGGWEYEYKIDAASGSLLEHDRDRDD